MLNIQIDCLYPKDNVVESSEEKCISQKGSLFVKLYLIFFAELMNLII